MTSDPIGPNAGLVLLNGNAESPRRFVRLALDGLGPSRHRDPAVRRRGTALIITGAWGPGERGDGALRRALLAQDVPHHDNLGVYGALRRFLAERPVVQALFEEHAAVRSELLRAYTEENDATVARMRAAWGRATEPFPHASMRDWLDLGGRPPPGPPTRPASHLLKVALAGQVRRAVDSLVEADDRHAQALRELWEHFHLAAGLEFDSFWQDLRRAMHAQIFGASMILLPGGSPAYLLEALRFFQLGTALTEALRRGTGFFGSSAGAMVLGRRIVIFNDRGDPRQEFQLYDLGMGLVAGLQIFPHCTDRVQTDDPANLTYLAERFRHRACAGLNAGSVLQLSAQDGRWHARSTGDEAVVIFGHDGQKVRYEPGEEVLEVG